MERFHDIAFYQVGRVKQHLLVVQKDPREYTYIERKIALREYNRRQRHTNNMVLRCRRALHRLTVINILTINYNYWMAEWVMHTDPQIQADVNRGLMSKLEGRYHHIRADIAEFFLQYAPIPRINYN